MANEQEMIFPSPVIFKGENDAYLKVWSNHRDDPSQHVFLQFSGAKYESQSKFEVINQPDGYVAIRSVHNGKYWNGDPISPQSNRRWIRANGDSIDQYSLFKPVKYDDNRVVFICKVNNQYCKRFTADGWDSLLSAQIGHIDPYSIMIVKEPVIRRTVNNVVYDLDAKDITKLESVVLNEQVVSNNSDLTSTFAVNYTHTYSKSSTFTRSLFSTAGVKTTFTAGIPLVFEGKVKISALVTGSLEWGTTETDTSSVSGTVTVKDLTPGKKIKVTVSGEKAHVKVPFKYQQIDYLSDGTSKTTDMFDGVFIGMNEYFSCTDVVNLN